MTHSTLTDSCSSSFFQRPKVLKIHLKTFHHLFGDFVHFFRDVEDPRMPRKDNYPLASLLFTGVFLFLFRLQAVRQIKFRLHTDAAKITFRTLFGISSIPHGDTLNATFSELDPDQLGRLPSAMVRTLIRKRVLEEGRFLRRYYLIAVDGTGVYVFRQRHCEHCTTKIHNGKTVYYHMVLEAKLITSNGFAFSIMSEFIENHTDRLKACHPGKTPTLRHPWRTENPSKQDCEIKAFHRLAKRLKMEFPKLPILLLLDGLFAEGPVFDICQQHRWEFLIVLRDGDLPSVNREFRNLLPLNRENVKTIRKDDLVQHFSWINDIDYRDTRGRIFVINVLQCQERLVEEKTHRWISSLAITQETAVELVKSGRNRWVIENQGFNTQKNSGFALEHSYSKDPAGMKVYYFLLQIAHIWTQLCERGTLLKKACPEGFGALKNIAFLSLEDWRLFMLSEEMWLQICKPRIQIRFDTS